MIRFETWKNFIKYTFLGFIIFFSNNIKAEGIHELTLEDAIRKSINHDPKLKSASHLLNANESQKYSHIAKFFPIAYIDTKLATHKDRLQTEYETMAPLVARERNHYLGELVVEQNLFAGFSDYSSFKVNRSESESRYFSLQQTKLETALATIECYFTIQYLRIYLESAKNHVNNLRAQLKESENKWKSGRATELDYLTYLYEFEKQNPLIMEIQHHLKIEVLRLSEMLGEVLHSEIVFEDAIIPAFKALANKNYPSSNEMEKIFLERNFKFLSMQKDLEVSEYKVGQVLASHAPSLSAQYRLQQSADRRNEILDQDNRTQMVLLQLHIPIFSGLSSLSQRQEAIELKASKSEEIHTWLQSARLELIQLRDRLDYLKVLVESEKLNESVALKRVSSLQTQYQLGKVTVKDYLDSLALHLQVKTNLAEAQKNFIVAYFKLKGMLGEFPMDFKN